MLKELNGMKMTVGNYLLKRVHELGITDIFGVPGDYNLEFLDLVVTDKGLIWRGNCNELNGAYAADGYARIRGVSALLTTFGVGEMSAINGIAGAYAEYVPVVHIVGMPASVIQEKKLMVHHSLGDGDFNVFVNLYRSVTTAQTILKKRNAAYEIDRVLKACWLNKRPVYIGLPSDVAYMEIEIDEFVPLCLNDPKSDIDAVNEAVERTARLLEKAKQPVLLIDLGAQRYPMKPIIEKFLDGTGIPFASTNMTKSLFDESHPQYLGIYAGNYSYPGVKEQVESSDCLISIGFMPSDMNTSGFSTIIDNNVTIEIHHNCIHLKNSYYKSISYSDYLPALIQRLSDFHYQTTITKKLLTAIDAKTNLAITQERFWQHMQAFLEPNTIVLAETGTSLFGILDIQLPNNTTCISQILWASIGYSVGALLGTCLAAPDRQSVLFVGDGSFQLTAQELSTMINAGQSPIIFLINNDGYTIERAIHGATQPYNDIQMWHYHELPKVFGENVWSAKVSTEIELEDALQELKQHNKKLRFIEVIMDKMDMPKVLKHFS